MQQALHMPANYGVRSNILIVPFTLDNYEQKQNHATYRSVDSLILAVFQLDVFVLALANGFGIFQPHPALVCSTRDNRCDDTISTCADVSSPITVNPVFIIAYLSPFHNIFHSHSVYV